jgi:hypothetical protein
LRNSTIRLITVVAAVIVLGIIALIVRATSHSGTPTSGGFSDGSTAVPTAPAQHLSGSVTSTCTLGWFGGASNTFTPGTAPSNQDPGGFQATLTNATSSPVQVSWVNVTIYLHGREVGNQTLQNDTADVIQPHHADSSWSTQFVPNEGEAKVPLQVMNATNGNIEDRPGFTCRVNQWGNATGA